VAGIPTTDMIGFYSFRQLPGYSGNCLTTRRASDNTSLAVGFDSGYLKKSDISTFCSGTDGHALIWNDQSGQGNSLNMSDLTGTAALPLIYSGGAFYVVNGKEGVNFSGNRYLRLLGGLTRVQFKSMFAVIKVTSFGTVNYLLWNTITKTDAVFLGGTTGGVSGMGILENGALKFQNTSENTNQNLHSYISGSQKKVWTNDADEATEAAPFSEIYFSGVSRQGFSINGTLQELILYSSDQTANRAAIQDDINAYYSIY